MKRVSWLFLFTICFLFILSSVGCNSGNTAESTKNDTQNGPVEITISAAASLQNSLTELKDMYAREASHVKLTFVFGGSGTLQQQIEQGAPVDLFISAGETQMNALEQKSLLVKESRVDLLGNELVLVTGKNNNNIKSLEDLAKPSVGQISIGTPESVPAGKYAEESLTNLKLWDALKQKSVLAKDVSQVLNYVETENVEAGIVYKSDALASTKVKVAAVVPASSHRPIVYPAAVVLATKNKQAAENFLKYLQGSDAQQIFINYGFLALTK